VNQMPPFSLTLTLSRWERGQQLDTLIFAIIRRAADQFQFAKKPGIFLPLPKGEGWGEEEGIIHI
jgi:hypothetical protein